MTMTTLALLLGVLAAVPVQRVYHEAWCPAVREPPMTRMSRETAARSGIVPAEDCHSGRVTFLGYVMPGAEPADRDESSEAEESAASSDREFVRGYTRADGTPVRSHWRR